MDGDISLRSAPSVAARHVLATLRCQTLISEHYITMKRHISQNERNTPRSYGSEYGSYQP